MQMRSYIGLALVALVAGVCLTPLARKLALAVGAVDAPRGRSVHAYRTPRLGGLAIAAAWCLAVLVFMAFDDFTGGVLQHTRSYLAAVIGGGGFMCAVGAVDDIRGLRASRKLIAQLAAAIAAFALGFRIDAISLPFFGTVPMGAFALPVTTLWVVGITNAVNLIDGLDGLAAGVAFFAALTSFTVACLTGNQFVAVLSAPLMGVLAGFLLFNFNPARIFMGDSGSYFLGFTLATLSIVGGVQQKATTAVSLLVPILALGLPIFDTLFTMFRRFLERRSVFSPDRGHIHHRLIDLGLTHRRAVMLLYAVCVVFTAAAVGVSLGRTWPTGVALVAVSAVCVALIRFAGYFEYLHALRRQRSEMYEPTAECLRRWVPVLLRHLGEAQHEDDVHAILEQSLALCRMDCLTLENLDGSSRRIFPTGMTPRSEREAVRASYMVGRADQARARVCFVWASDRPDPSPQSAILLQLVVDGLAAALTACKSPFAPAAAPSGAEYFGPSTLPLPSSTASS